MSEPLTKAFPDRIDENVLRRALEKKGAPGLRVIYHEMIGSTNTEAKRLAHEGIPTLIVAGAQSGGRGRLGKSFDCPSGVGIYFSLLFYPRIKPAEIGYLTAGAAVAAAKATEGLCGFADGRIKIKWVNDLYIDEKKLAGILTEGSASSEDALEYAVIGIGLNIRSRDFGELSEIATSIEDAGGDLPTRASLIGAIVSEIYRLDSRENILNEYKSRSLLTGRAVEIKSGTKSFGATVLGIGDDLSLLVARECGRVESLISAEVSTKLIKDN